MNPDCDIIRDLMPMCIDKTASEKSREMVEAHVAQCPPCQKVYAEMNVEAKTDLPAQPATPEFTQTVRRMRSHRKRRTWLTIALSVLTAVCLCLAGMWGYQWYYQANILFAPGSISAVTTADGMVLLRLSDVPEDTVLFVKLRRAECPQSAEAQYDVYFHAYATRHDLHRSSGTTLYFFLNGSISAGNVRLVSYGQETDVCRMLLGNGNGGGRVFYLSGDALETVEIRGEQLKTPAEVHFDSSNLVMSVVTPTPAPTAE